MGTCSYDGAITVLNGAITVLNGAITVLNGAITVLNGAITVLAPCWQAPSWLSRAGNARGTQRHRDGRGARHRPGGLTPARPARRLGPGQRPRRGRSPRERRRSDGRRRIAVALAGKRSCDSIPASLALTCPPDPVCSRLLGNTLPPGPPYREHCPNDSSALTCPPDPCVLCLQALPIASTNDHDDSLLPYECFIRTNHEHKCCER